MSMQQDRIKSLLFDHPATIPVSVSILPAAWMEHREAMDEVVARYPLLFGEQAGERDYDPAACDAAAAVAASINIWIREIMAAGLGCRPSINNWFS